MLCTLSFDAKGVGCIEAISSPNLALMYWSNEDRK